MNKITKNFNGLNFFYLIIVLIIFKYLKNGIAILKEK